MNSLVLILLVVSSVLISIHAGSITRYKRGYLSRTGICPDPATNFQIKDIRLNYMGTAVVLEGDSEPPCSDPECNEDSHCNGDRKCCKNYCGAGVCTVSIRDPDPCNNFDCPTGQTCKIQNVKCVMPECADATAINRPTCIPIETINATNTATLGDFQPDTAKVLQQFSAMQHDAAKDNGYTDVTQGDAATFTASAVGSNTAYQSPDSSLLQTPMMQNVSEASNNALSFSDQQQSFAAPSDQPLPVPTDTASIAQAPIDTINSVPVPSTDMSSFQGPPQSSSPVADQPFPDAQIVAQTPVQSSPLVRSPLS